jgi:uncharacterized protein YqhQ
LEFSRVSYRCDDDDEEEEEEEEEEEKTRENKKKCALLLLTCTLGAFVDIWLPILLLLLL